MALFGRSSAADDARAVRWAEWGRETEPFAIVSLVLGIFSFIELNALVFPGVASLILGCIALARLRPRNGTPTPRPRGAVLAWAGIGLSAVSIGLGAWLYLARPDRATVPIGATQASTSAR